jgi:hypothetical protein
MVEIKIGQTYRYSVASSQQKKSGPPQPLWSVGTVIKAEDTITLRTIHGRTVRVKPQRIISPVEPVVIDKDQLLAASIKSYEQYCEVKKLPGSRHRVWPGQSQNGIVECIVDNGQIQVRFVLPEKMLSDQEGHAT